MYIDYITIKHPIRGRIAITRDPDTTQLDCHWPASGETGAWIDINLAFDSRHYLWGIRHLLDTGSTQIDELNGSLSLKSIGKYTEIGVRQHIPPLAVTYTAELPARAFAPSAE